MLTDHRSSPRGRALIGATVVLGVLLAGACSSHKDDAGESSDHVAMEGAVTPGAGEGEWDPEEWEPTVHIEPQRVTDAERNQHREELMARRAQEYGLESPPGVELIAWAQSMGEHADLMAECLQEAGFPAVSNGVSGTYFDPGVPESQSDALDLAYYVCDAQYPIEPRYMQDWSQAQVGLVYDYWEEYFIPCMDAHGHTIDDSHQPSREAYVAAFHTPERIGWWPNDDFQRLSLDQQRVLKDVCPPYPPDSAMYGE